MYEKTIREVGGRLNKNPGIASVKIIFRKLKIEGKSWQSA